MRTSNSYNCKLMIHNMKFYNMSDMFTVILWFDEGITTPDVKVETFTMKLWSFGTDDFVDHVLVDFI